MRTVRVRNKRTPESGVYLLQLFFSKHYVSLLLVEMCPNNSFLSREGKIFLFFTGRVDVSNETNSLFVAILMFLYVYFTLC